MRAGAGLDPKALREAREARGLTQHQLARLIGAEKPAALPWE